mgnify:CR=1 FL=1
MKPINFHLIALALALSACSMTAAEIVSGDAAATARFDQYGRDAAATETQRALSIEANIRNLQSTDAAGTAQAAAAQQTAIASAAAQVVAATQQAVIAATGTARTESGMTQTAAAQFALTQAASIRATETAAVEATRIQIALDTEQAKANRDNAVAWAGWIAAFAFVVIAIALIALAGVVAIRVYRKRQSFFTHGSFANPLLLLDAPGGGQVVFDPLRMFGAATVIDHAGVNAPQLAPPEYQERTTARAQAVAMLQAQHSPHAPIVGIERITNRKIGAAEWHEETRPIGETGRTTPQRIGAGNQAERAIALPTGAALPQEAAWRMMNDWRGGGLPLGMGASGLLLADPETSPHLLMAGTSGSGKTRYGLRPLIAAALADGWQVAIFDRSGLDFLPFRNHPNASLALLQDPAEAIGYLQSLYAEVEKRFEILREAGVSTWGRLEGDHDPRVLAVFDEFSNLADALPAAEREELWRGARMIAAEGRKAGVHLALALQDPTARSIDLRIRRNCTPLSFRVKDGEASRVILGASGAEALPPRHFLTVLGELRHGMAFAPDDGEIAAFIAARQPSVHPSPSWLVGRQPAAIVDSVGVEQQVRKLAAAGVSLGEIQRRVLGTNGGRDWYRVKGILSAAAPTTT